MEASLIGNRAGQRAVITIGVFDPFTIEHIHLLGRLRLYAGSAKLTSAAVLLDPRPAALAQGGLDWPVYHNLTSRMKLLQHFGTDATVLIKMRHADAERGFSELIAAITEVLSVGEIWLGASQSFGTGALGSQQTIWSVARGLGIRVTGLSKSPWAGLSSQIIEYVRRGAIREAIRLAGVPPIFMRHNDEAENAVINWPEGKYDALVFGDGSEFPRRSIVSVERTDVGTQFRWPEPSSVVIFY